MVDISVIIPLYNKENYIEETLKSVINQQFDNYEILIIDDNSDDNSVRVAVNFLSSYDKINYKIITNKINKGVSYTRNIGIENSKGRYLFFLDADDKIDRNMLFLLYKKAVKQNCDIVFSGYNYFSNNKIVKKYNQYFNYFNGIKNGEEVLKLLIKGKIRLCIGNNIIKSSVIKNNDIKFNKDNSFGEDQEYFYKCLYEADNVTCIKKELLFYVQSKDSLSNDFNDIKYNDLFNWLENIIDYFYKKNKKIAKIIYNEKKLLSYATYFKILSQKLEKYERIIKMNDVDLKEIKNLNIPKNSIKDFIKGFFLKYLTKFYYYILLLIQIVKKKVKI